MFDLYATVHHLLKLNNRLKEFQLAFNRFREQYAKRTEGLKNVLLDRFEQSEYYGERLKKLFNINWFQSKRLIRAFPDLRLLKYNDAWQKLKSILLDNNKSKR
jgi:transcription initiation factor IIE alpha subunit